VASRLAAFHQIVNHQPTDVPYLTAAWQHFVGHEYDPEDFARTSVDFVRRWDWDWVKINPRATYYSEAWGATYDPDDYDGVIPKAVRPAVTEPGQLARITPLEAAATPVLAEHIASARAIKAELPDRAVLQTVFSPLSVLYQLAALSLYRDEPFAGYTTELRNDDLLRHPSAPAALAAITATLVDYTKALLRPAADGGAGLDGIFYAVTGTASEGLIPKADFDRFSTPYDLAILEAAAPGLRVLHTCRARSNPDWFAGWPISALQWDQHLPGNPGPDAAFPVVPVAGPSRDLFEPGADLAEIGRQLDAVKAARKGRPFLLAASCTVPTPAAEAALTLLRQA